MVGPICCPKVHSNIRNCNDWYQLYELITSNPRLYNVHLCLTRCDKSLICGELIFYLFGNGYLIKNEISIYYDYYENFENLRDVPGNRSFMDYIQYLGRMALLEEDTESYNRYSDAWNAPVAVMLYRQSEAKNRSLNTETSSDFIA